MIQAKNFLPAIVRERATPWHRMKPQVMVCQHISAGQLVSEALTVLWVARGCLVLLLGQGFIMPTCGNSTKVCSAPPCHTDRAVSSPLPHPSGPGYALLASWCHLRMSHPLSQGGVTAHQARPRTCRVGYDEHNKQNKMLILTRLCSVHPAPRSQKKPDCSKVSSRTLCRLKAEKPTALPPSV